MLCWEKLHNNLNIPITICLIDLIFISFSWAEIDGQPSSKQAVSLVFQLDIISFWKLYQYCIPPFCTRFTCFRRKWKTFFVRWAYFCIAYELLMLKQTSPLIEFVDYFLAQEMIAARLSVAIKAFSKFVSRIHGMRSAFYIASPATLWTHRTQVRHDCPVEIDGRESWINSILMFTIIL